VNTQPHLAARVPSRDQNIGVSRKVQFYIDRGARPHRVAAHLSAINPPAEFHYVEANRTPVPLGRSVVAMVSSIAGLQSLLNAPHWSGGAIAISRDLPILRIARVLQQLPTEVPRRYSFFAEAQPGIDFVARNVCPLTTLGEMPTLPDEINRLIITGDQWFTEATVAATAAADFQGRVSTDHLEREQARASSSGWFDLDLHPIWAGDGTVIITNKRTINNVHFDQVSSVVNQFRLMVERHKTGPTILTFIGAPHMIYEGVQDILCGHTIPASFRFSNSGDERVVARQLASITKGEAL
jgi:hypothetical protein